MILGSGTLSFFSNSMSICVWPGANDVASTGAKRRYIPFKKRALPPRHFWLQWLALACDSASPLSSSGTNLAPAVAKSVQVSILMIDMCRHLQKCNLPAAVIPPVRGRGFFKIPLVKNASFSLGVMDSSKPISNAFLGSCICVKIKIDE